MVYALAKTKDGAIYIEVMTVKDIEKVRASSRAKGAGPWTQWGGEMARKTVIRRLSTRLPMSTDLDETIRADDDMYNVTAEPQPVTPAPAESTRLKKIVAAADGKEPGPVPEPRGREPGDDDEPVSDMPL